ncbi:BTB/POZ domain-containing protein [Phthorimaea operculella]|nr:BTB/POZ domain-containing protein [Phthorimaea operculella]
MCPNKEGARPYKCREYANKISLNLHHFKRDGRFCDIDLVSGKTKVKAHRVVLAASCAYFDAMFSTGLEESQKGHVALHSVPPDILPMIIDFIYTGHQGGDLHEMLLNHCNTESDSELLTVRIMTPFLCEFKYDRNQLSTSIPEQPDLLFKMFRLDDSN